MTYHIIAEYNGKPSRRTYYTKTLANIVKDACARHGIPCQVEKVHG